MTQITNVYKAFIQLTKTFFVDNNSNATLNSTAGINLLPTSGSIQINSPNNITMSASNELTIGTTVGNNMNIMSMGNLNVSSQNNTIYLLNQENTNNLGIVWGSGVPILDNYNIGSLYIDFSAGDLYIYKTEGWIKLNS
jgi:hypothetical protein